ncbi:head maturation protease, ClpP-related [Alicyclobacillus dauci]|uniref:ATP-dependent Clp protease proteolytic subunit n=1 Tax=Alicyclobacillus dauci TaxID=1475485 RepID=A0ABY6Z705_9BACL|nr:head maturation protease, ClpP-related [Alicyclobacillus dauci]WAH38612.1 Clp protease ClpP [Alicyclobacillus dauci]
MTKHHKKFWSFRNDAATGSGELYLYGIIESETWWGDEITPNQFQADLNALGNVSQIDVYINSDGGDVFAGQAILSMLKRHPANVTVHIDGLAASIASVIAMAGDQVLMPRNAMMMVHNPWSFAFGNAADFRKLADDLDQIRESLIAAYQDKTGMDRDQLVALLDAETWLTADEAVQMGFADEIEQSKQISASVRNGRLLVNGQEMDLSRYRNVPRKVAAASVPSLEQIAEDPDGADDMAPLFTVGSDVQLTISPRIPGQSTGDVREVVLTYAYGILFDGMENDGIYHWYLESELASYVETQPESNARRNHQRMIVRDGMVPPDVSETLAPKDTAWTKPTLGDFTDKQWSDLSDDEKNHIAGHYAWAREMPPMTFADLKLPHHRPSDGAVVWEGVANAAARLPQSNIPEADIPKVQAELGKHYKQFGETPPWEQEDSSKDRLGSQRPNGSLSLFERRVKNNERRLVK